MKAACCGAVVAVLGCRPERHGFDCGDGEMLEACILRYDDRDGGADRAPVVGTQPARLVSRYLFVGPQETEDHPEDSRTIYNVHPSARLTRKLRIVAWTGFTDASREVLGIVAEIIPR